MSVVSFVLSLCIMIMGIIFSIRIYKQSKELEKLIISQSDIDSAIVQRYGQLNQSMIIDANVALIALCQVIKLFI